MTDRGDVPPPVLARLRPVCLGLPEAYEEPAWIGIRWRIRQRTFAHVYSPDLGRNPFYARRDEPTVMTFRVPLDDLAGLTSGGYPFFPARWGRDVVVAFLDDDTDWAEIAELVADSYRGMAPKFLAARVSVP